MDSLGTPRKGLILTEGVILAILGTLSLVWPVLSTFGLEILLGWLLLIGGAVQGYRAFQSKGESGFWGTFFLSILFLLFGMLWLVYPVAGVISLGLFLLFFFFSATTTAAPASTSSTTQTIILVLSPIFGADFNFSAFKDWPFCFAFPVP